MTAPSRPQDWEDLASQVAATALEMSRRGLSPQKSGNVSARTGNHMLITPSGMAYDAIAPDDIAVIALDGRQLAGRRKPSSETPLHLDIYNAFAQAGAIVHCHSPAATSLACMNRNIPAFHYMVAVAGGTQIPCAPYATFGSSELASLTAHTLKTTATRACLMSHHGQIAHHDTLTKALDLASEVETLAQQYLNILPLGEPEVLSDEEMSRVLERFEGYGH